MKKVFCSLLLLNLIVACNSSNTSSTTTSPDSSGSGNTPGHDNVNGNVPDTTSTIHLNKPLPKDSSRIKDSTPH